MFVRHTTQSAPRISREPFDTESPNFTRTSITDTLYSHTGYDITILPVRSYRENTVENVATDSFGSHFS